MYLGLSQTNNQTISPFVAICDRMLASRLHEPPLPRSSIAPCTSTSILTAFRPSLNFQPLHLHPFFHYTHCAAPKTFSLIRLPRLQSVQRYVQRRPRHINVHPTASGLTSVYALFLTYRIMHLGLLIRCYYFVGMPMLS